MAEEGLESKEIEEGIEEQKELDDDGDSKVNISSEGFTSNSPFRRSNFPRVPPYYRFSSWHTCAKDITWRNLNLSFLWTNNSFVKTRFLPPSIPYSPAVPQVGRISFILQFSFLPHCIWVWSSGILFIIIQELGLPWLVPPATSPTIHAAVNHSSGNLTEVIRTVKIFRLLSLVPSSKCNHTLPSREKCERGLLKQWGWSGTCCRWRRRPRMRSTSQKCQRGWDTTYNRLAAGNFPIWTCSWEMGLF